MWIEAEYDHGRLKFPETVRLKHQRFTVRVEIPGEELETQGSAEVPPDVVERARTMLARMEAIKNAPLSAEEDLPELTQKQLDRLDASALRDEIKGMRER